MRALAPVRVRLFLVAWLLCALHFATNVVREHYPAFALVAHGSLRCDEWAGLHPDLFRHTDGHWYANNNVGASLAAAPVLLLFEPLLAKLEEIGRREAAQAAAEPETPTFESDYPLRRKFMAEVRRRGLHLRLGAAAAITATLVMAPAAALLALIVFDLLRRRGVPERRAAALTLVFALATPLLFRSALLSHNQLEALVSFTAFALLWRGGEPAAAPTGRLVAAGLLAGAAVLFDYSGVVLLAALGLYAVAVERRRSSGAGAAMRAALRFGAGALAGVALLALTQWWQFGDPLTPAQRWMPDAHFSVRGWHGFDWPSRDLLWKSLVDPSFGLFAFAPLLLLALLPVATPAILPRRERRLVLAFSAAFLLFCAANQFTRLQWNTGLRALAPLVPFLFLAASDRLARLSPRALALLAAPCALHSWVVAMARATPPVEPASFADSTIARSWRALFAHGIELPWLTVWRQTQPRGGPWWSPMAAPLLVAATIAALVLLWRVGDRAARAAATEERAA